MARRRKDERRAPHHEALDAMRSLLLPCAATEVSLRTVGCRSGATPRGPSWTPAVTRAHGCDGPSARRMAVLWTCRAPSLGRHVRRACLRNTWLDFTPSYTPQLLATTEVTARHTVGLCMIWSLAYSSIAMSLDTLC